MTADTGQVAADVQKVLMLLKEGFLTVLVVCDAIIEDPHYSLLELKLGELFRFFFDATFHFL